MTGAKIKAIKPLTPNPGTKIDASQKHKPLTTREKVPKLKRLSGNDKTEIMGLIPELTKPIAVAAIKAAGKLANLTPGKIRSTTSKLKAVANKVKSVLSIFSSL
jgi:hypothetical protein